jgi:hypothetical protein
MTSMKTTAATTTQALRDARRALQVPGTCKKHPGAASRRFDIEQAGMPVHHAFLCIDCTKVLTALGARLH